MKIVDIGLLTSEHDVVDLEQEFQPILEDLHPLHVRTSRNILRALWIFDHVHVDPASYSSIFLQVEHKSVQFSKSAFYIQWQSSWAGF